MVMYGPGHGVVMYDVRFSKVFDDLYGHIKFRMGNIRKKFRKA